MASKHGSDGNELLQHIFYLHIQMRFTRNRHMGEIGNKHVHFACMVTETGEATN